MITPESLQYFKEKLENGQELTKRELLVVISQLISANTNIEALDTRLIAAEAAIVDHEARITILEP